MGATRLKSSSSSSADDLGFADLGCYGGRDAAFGRVSPVIDQLAADGLRFTQGLQQLARVLAHAIRADDRPLPVPPARRCRRAHQQPQQRAARCSACPGRAHAAGHAARHRLSHRLIGKWHLGYPPHFSPLRSGYDEFFGPMSGGVDYFTHCSTTGAHDLYVGEKKRSKRATSLTSSRNARRTTYAVWRAMRGRKAVLPEPALHGAALAVGVAARRCHCS